MFFLLFYLLININCKLIKYPPSSLCSSFLGNTLFDNDIELCKIDCYIKSKKKFSNSTVFKCPYPKKTLLINKNIATALYNSTIKQHFYNNGKYIHNITNVKKGDKFIFESEVVEVNSTYNEQDWFTQFIPKPIKLKDPNKLSIIFFLFDGGSRYVMKNQLPKTVSILKKIQNKYSYYDMLRYHILGNNSPFNYPPLLCGISRDESKMNINRKIIFDDLKEEKYMIIHADGACDLNMVYYSKRLKNFTGADHSITKLSCDKKYVENMYEAKPKCAGHKEIHKHYFEYIKEAVTYYSKKNQPSFTFATFMHSHDPLFKSVPRLDNDLSLFIEDLDKNNIFNNTILIFYADHGMHYGFFPLTLFGKKDHKLPILNIV